MGEPFNVEQGPARQRPLRTVRVPEEIAALADGWNLVTPPGLVKVQHWSVDGSYQGEAEETVGILGMAAVLPGPQQGRVHASGGAR